MNDLQKKFANFQTTLDAVLAERTDEIHLLLCAAVAQHHLLFVSQPGCAKTFIAEAFAHWLDTEAFIVHMHNQLPIEAIFGPLQISRLAHDEYNRMLDGYAAAATVIILEEVFKASPGVFNTLLTLMSDRKYKEGHVKTDCPLRMILANSNEWTPQGYEEMSAAFFDRFLFRKQVMPIGSHAGRMKMLRNRNKKITFQAKLSIQELDQAHQEASNLEFTEESWNKLDNILEALKKVQIFPGDRRMDWSFIACQANAWLDGATQVEPYHLEILKHTLWTVPEHSNLTANTVVSIANPVSFQVNELMKEAEDALSKFVATDLASMRETNVKLGNILKKMKNLHGGNGRIEQNKKMIEEEIKRIRVMAVESVDI
jgi:MoxR-like ATPase